MKKDAEVKLIDVNGTYIQQEFKETLHNLGLIAHTSRKAIKSSMSLFKRGIGRPKKNGRYLSQDEIQKIYPNKLYA